MNIHILSNSPTKVNSGFGIVARNLAIGLHKLGHNISVSDMQNIYNKEYWNNITIYPMNSVSNATTGNNFYINELVQFQNNLKDSNADIVIIVYPAYNNVIASNHLHELHENTLWYYPVEGEDIPKTYVNELQKVKNVIPMTKQGRTELQKTELNNVIDEIYHGFDPDIFKQLNIDNKNDSEDLHYCIWSQESYMNMQDKRWLCKNGCFDCDGCNIDCENYTEEEVIINTNGNEFTGNISNLGRIKDDFGVETIISFTGENNGTRKKIDRLLASYSMIKKMDKNNEIMLIMHTMPVSNSGIDLHECVRKYDLDYLDKKLMFTYGTNNLGNSWTDNALNILYNISDINISCSSGEGFGLPTLESMACDCVNVGPDFSSFTEFIGNNENIKLNRGLLSKIQGYETLKNGMRRGLVSAKSTADNVMMLHENDKLRNEMSNNACNWSLGYTWDNICVKFDKLINELGVE